LLTTATITFIEALRTKTPIIQHIMNLETCISLVGGYFYSVFNDKITRAKEINWKEITKLRYIDWAITTPFMLLVLSLFLSFNSKIKIKFHWYLLTIIFNYIMLYAGYLGETGKLKRMSASIIGFIAFLMTFTTIFINYVLPKYSVDNIILFGMYFFIWSIYGIAYHFPELEKNNTMNYLDLISKCFIGIGLWVYYVKIIKVT
jgi:bacteriorhodopsin